MPTDDKRELPSRAGPTRREFLKESALGSVFVLLSPQIASPAPSDNQRELASGWNIISAREISARDQDVSTPSYRALHWHPIRRMPSTVLQSLQDAGVYKDLYVGMNLTEKAPPDLWKQDWWYRVEFDAPEAEVYSLIFNGINYRADVWLNGYLIADKSHVVGMYNSFEFIVSKYIRSGEKNILAVKVTPERKIPAENGVELADSWLDWINWKYIGIPDPNLQKLRGDGLSCVPDRNAGVWKRVFLSATGKVLIRNAYVVTNLPLPATSPASLTVYCDLRNGASSPVSGMLHGTITRRGKPTISFHQNVALAGDETKEVVFTSSDYPGLMVENPDLWWPYEWGDPALYDLTLRFIAGGRASDSSTIHFGIRKVTQHRDSDNQFPKVGTGGNFYLQVNGKDFLVRGACYTPDLLFKNDPNHDRAIIQYTKDMGMNMLRWELKIADDTMLDRADREGIPVMQGWMCCMQWEMWKQWDVEDHWVALASLRARIHNLRSHAAAFIWADGSDGRPPDAVRDEYHKVLKELHWQNAVVDTVSNYKKDAEGRTLWDGIHMLGPYSWRPPYYWFNGEFPAAQGSCAEQGDNESIPPFESLKKFIPADKLWPINEYWYYHAGANRGNSTLGTIRKVVEQRYGAPAGAEDFCKKAQLAHYENTRAQFEGFAANGWATHKMTLYWMLNSHWPSFFGHLIDYYLKPGGAYFGAKRGLRPLNLVFDYYAAGDRQTANIYLVNQTLETHRGLKGSVTIYDLGGKVKFSRTLTDDSLGPLDRKQALTIPRIAGITSTYFVRCQLANPSGKVIVDNVYWQSTMDDALANPSRDVAFTLDQSSWANFTALNTMAQAELEMSSEIHWAGEETRATITLRNPSSQIAFFVRAEVCKGQGGDEVLPVIYEDNYITLFPHEERTLWARFRTSDLGGSKPYLRVEGYNVARRVKALT
ncbi:MAG TPA: glycoside hydrolase [Terriglobia bacterium]|nr:glycoside hydrolase [Terriglobia bacterium]